MNKIHFCHNWNDKLNQNIFTTIRKFSQSKKDYYYDKLAEIFEVLLNNKLITQARLIEVESWEFSSLPLGLLHSDTGIVNNIEIDNIFKKFGINKNDLVLILTFKKEE